MRNGILEFLHSSISQLPEASSRFIARSDVQTTHCVLAACAFMRRFGKIRGVEQHSRFSSLLESGVRNEGDLRSWLHAYFPAANAVLWDTSLKRADEFLAAGINVFEWRAPFHGPPSDEVFPQPAAPTCPGVLFGKGRLPGNAPLFAIFNSRKPRLVSPESKWLAALRVFLSRLDPLETALAGSTGTLSYDLAGALAQRFGLLQLLVAPFPLVDAGRELPKIYGEGTSGITVLSCMLDVFTCSGKQAMRCRDRVLAALSDLHLVLEIRSHGNLLAVLEEIQSKSPRPQFVFGPGTRNNSNAGNYTLLTKFPENAHVFKLPGLQGSAAADSAKALLTPADKNSSCFSRKELRGPCSPLQRDDIQWGDYLFHYTRACAGPWPGETYRQYLVNLLDAHPLSGHSALETLMRIMRERLIRAGCRMVRGRAEVICWSSHPPQELFLMRKWNRALVRWTVEPYGIAVRQQVLRLLGAKPAIYGGEHVYSRLAESERHRFQLSCSGGSSSWRHEREWRVRGDLALGKIRPDQGFLFVQTGEEAARLCSYAGPMLPIVVLKP